MEFSLYSFVNLMILKRTGFSSNLVPKASTSDSADTSVLRSDDRRFPTM